MLRFFGARDWNPCLRDAVRQGTSQPCDAKELHKFFS